MKPLTKLLVIVIVGLGVVLGCSFYLIKPAMKKVGQMNEELRNKKSESKTLQEQIVAFKTAQSDLTKANQKERIANAYVGKFDLVNAIKSMETASAATNTGHLLTLTDPFINKAAAATPKETPKAASPSVIPNKQGIEEISYTLSAKNDFVGLLNYLEYLEHLPYFTEISKLELNAESGGGAVLDKNVRLPHSGLINARIEGVLFITKDEGN